MNLNGCLFLFIKKRCEGKIFCVNGWICINNFIEGNPDDEDEGVIRSGSPYSQSYDFGFIVLCFFRFSKTNSFISSLEVDRTDFKIIKMFNALQHV